MNKLDISQDITRWEKSKEKINQLLKEDDISTVIMMEFYNKYIRSHYNEVARSLFDLSFNNWYEKNMKG